MSNTHSLIEQLYQEEQKRLANEATFTPLDMSISAADMAMLSTIAKRFGKDKSLFAREALTQALVDMFSALEPAERKMLAKEADELAQSISTEMAEEQGLSDTSVTGTNWVSQDKACVREEKKAEKERMKREQELKNDTAMTAETNMSDAAATQEEEAIQTEVESESEQTTEEPLVQSTESNNSEADSMASIFGTN